MKHKWVEFGQDREFPFRRLRRCLRCGAFQEYVEEQTWMRVTSKKWEPTKLTRKKCPGLKT